MRHESNRTIKNIPKQRPAAIVALLLLTLLSLAPAACSDSVFIDCEAEAGNPDNPNTNPNNNPNNDESGIAASLDAMGVDTAETPRVDEVGIELPDDYSPLGQTFVAAQTDELFIVGPQLQFLRPDGEPELLENRVAIVELADDATGAVGPVLTDVLEPGTVWEQDSRSAHPSMGASSAGLRSLRAAAASDLDGDGRDELAVVYVLANEAQDRDDVWLRVIDDQDDESGAAEMDELVLSLSVVRDVAVAGGDFDGDGVGDLVVGISTNDSAQWLVLERATEGGVAVVDGVGATYAVAGERGEIALALAAGNIDRDNGDELVVVVNEALDNFSALTRYFIYDDAQRDYAALASDVEIEAGSPLPIRAMVADPAIGDIDADGVGEVVFGGLAEFHNDACMSYQHVYLAIEDAASGSASLAPIGDHTADFPYIPSGTGCNQASHQLKARYVFVNALDIDGDGIDEIQAGLSIFEDFTEAPAFTEIYTLPPTEILRDGRTVGGVISPATTAMVTGDVDADGRDDIISFVQWRNAVSVWGIDGPGLETAEFRQTASIETAFYNGQTRVFPILVTADLDRDGLALQYSEGERHFVFTEPVLIAALAAAPCAEDIGQNTGACVTTYGTTESQDLGVDGTVTVSASTFVSAGGDFFGFGAEARETVTKSASFSAGRAYSLEETVEYTTGPIEDTVIFTTIPLDQYVYTVISHPDPEQVGQTVVVNLPRTPITVQVERNYYNDHIPEGAFRVDERVFGHMPGDVFSYPTEAEADAAIATGGLGHLGPVGEVIDAAGEAVGDIAERLLGRGLKASRAVTVGQGGGQTSTEIRFSQQTDYRAGAEVAYEAELEVSGGGVSVGGSIGGSVGAGISWGSGSSTVYRGSIGSIDAANFADNVYSVGLYTYVYNYGDPSQPQFEVIGYWVER